MNYEDIVRSALQAPKPLSRQMQRSVMTKEPAPLPELQARAYEPGWKPEQDALENVSPEDWIPNPKSVVALGSKALPALGAIGSIKGQKELLAALRKGALPGDQAVRYEVAGRPLFDKNVAHYDVTGGKQAHDILRFPQMDEEGELLSRSQVIANNKAAQFRINSLRNVPEEQATFVPHDRWMYARVRSNLLKPKEHQFYVNDAEGSPVNVSGMPIPKVKDILNDPDLRRAYNMSLAVPANSDFHQMAKIIRDPGSTSLAPPSLVLPKTDMGNPFREGTPQYDEWAKRVAGFGK